jgi:polyisoprenoid-binding protein YceI
MAIWKIDQAHSEIKFKVKHLVVSTVTGQFNDFSATIESEKSNFSDAKISFEAAIDSIDTKNEQRDGHLKSADFFDAGNYPKLTFVSKSLKKKSDNTFEITGDMTIRGITKEIKIEAVYNGTVKGFGGTDVAGFEITGKLNRFDFGLKWNTLTEAGGIVVGEEIKIEIAVELQKVEKELVDTDSELVEKA